MATDPGDEKPKNISENTEDNNNQDSPNKE